MMRSKRGSDSRRVRERPSSDETGIRALRRRAHRAAILLHEEYGSPRHGNKSDPLDELVFIILSQMTTHHSFNRVFDRLKEAAPTWDDVLAMPLRRFKALIKDAGLSEQKGPRIRAILRRVRRDFGGTSLDTLRSWNDPDIESYLTSLPGVGVKTARCVMMYAFDRKVLPVDTHVGRVMRRLGLIEEGISYEQMHDVAEHVTPPADRYAMHVNAVSHGRAVCLALYPRCATCCLRRLCPSADEDPRTS